MSCSCRISELHALSYDKLAHDKSWSVVYLEPKSDFLASDFLAKNQALLHADYIRQFTVKALVKPACKTSFLPNSYAAIKYRKCFAL